MNNSLIPAPGNDLRSPTQTAWRHHTRRGRRRVGENRETESGVSGQRRVQMNRGEAEIGGRRGARGSARRRGSISRGERSRIEEVGQVYREVVSHRFSGALWTTYRTPSNNPSPFRQSVADIETCNMSYFLGDDFLAMIIAGRNTWAEQKIEGLRRSG